MGAVGGEGQRKTLPDEDTVKIRVWIGTSRIAGNGLFAAQDIKKDTRIIRYTGEKISKEESDRRATSGNAYIFQFAQFIAVCRSVKTS